MVESQILGSRNWMLEVPNVILSQSSCEIKQLDMSRDKFYAELFRRNVKRLSMLNRIENMHWNLGYSD